MFGAGNWLLPGPNNSPRLQAKRSFLSKFHLNANVVANSSSVDTQVLTQTGEKSRAFKLYLIAFQKSNNISCLTAN